jgi:endoglucanase
MMSTLLRRALAVLFPALLAAAPATGPATRPAPRNAVRPTPLPFMLGVNLCGGEFGEKQLPGVFGKSYTYPTAKELDYYKSKNLLLIRLPFRWERLQPTLNGPLEAAELARIDAFIAEAAKREMKVIPEPHNFARYRGELIGTPEAPNAAFADLWRRLAEHFRDQPAVYAYALVNEPHHTNGLWPDAAQAAVDAIRTVDTTHHILVPGDGWSGAADWLKNNRDLWINDPSNRIAYEAHLYFDADRSGRYTKPYDQEKGSPTVGVERLKPFVDWLEERNAIGFIGEFGVPANAGDDPRWLETLAVFVRRLRELQMPGCYWAGGPWWGGYALSIEPKDGVDRPQMKVMGAGH